MSKADEVLARCCPDPAAPVFVIGVTERGVTVASQQRRAIKLVDALVQLDRVAAGSRVAIVGAGAAGLTAAVRAAHAGCRVTIFERDAELLSTFRGNHSRLLHPNLYRWPDDGWQHRDAELPLLSWSADKAGVVAQRIEAQFRDELRCGLIEVRHGVTLDQAALRPDADGMRLICGGHDEVFAVVILAVGFGRERFTGPGSPGYWSNDNLEEAMGSAPLHHLILGAGDGGLTDLLRLRLSKFDQDDLIPTLLPDGDPPVESLKADVRRIEAITSSDAMHAAYCALAHAWLDDRIRDAGLRPNQVVLADGFRPAFGRGRFALNKLLASRLTRSARFGVEWLPRSWPARTLPTASRSGARWRVDLGAGDVREFDRVLYRLGAEPAIASFGATVTTGCDAMTRHGTDLGVGACDLPPPPGSGPRALAHAVRPCRRVIDVLETLLLFLRKANRSTLDLVDDPAFTDLGTLALEAISKHTLVALECAPEIARAAADFLLEYPVRFESLRGMPCGAGVEVAARALVEAMELRWRDGLRRSLRGPVGIRRRAVYGPNRICPRELAPHDASDVGAGTLTLVPPGDVSLEIEWRSAVWLARLQIATGQVIDSIDDLAIPSWGAGATLFFGVGPTDPGQHAGRLARLALALAGRPIDLVVLPEFSLSADPAWGSNLSRTSGSIVFAGRGHLQIGPHQAHRSVVAFPELTTQLGKSLPGQYLRGGQTASEDIHRENATLFAVGDGSHLIALVTEDAARSDAVVGLMKTLRPSLVLGSGSQGSALSAVCDELDLPHLIALFGPPINRASSCHSSQVIDIT